MSKLRLCFEIIGVSVVVLAAVIMISNPKLIGRIIRNSPPIPPPSVTSSEYLKNLEDENRRLKRLVDSQNILLRGCGKMRVVSLKSGKL